MPQICSKPGLGLKCYLDGDICHIDFGNCFKLNPKPKAAAATSLSAAPGSATKPGLTEAETSEYNDLLIRHIGEVTQEDWLRLHELNDRYIEALRG